MLALASLAVSPALAASHTISAGTVVYDGATFGSDDILVDGATAVLQIDGGGLTLSNAVSLENGGTLDNAGSISHSGPGVSGTTGTVSNHDGGVIESLDDYGVYFELGGTVTNGAGSSISGTTGVLDDWPAGSGPGSVTNAGTITGTADSGVDLENGGSVLNQDGGAITGAVNGVYAWEGVGITNTGAGSLIHGDYVGISLNDGGSLDNLDGAAITGGDVGVGVFEGGTVTNGGGATITGTNNDGVYLAAGGTLINSGTSSTIFGGWNGVHVAGDIGNVTNTDGATITGGGAISSAAIYLEQGGTVSNGAGARIVGDSSNGVYGIYASQATSVSNAGTIVGDVRLADGLENHVTLFTGSHIEGDLYASTGNEESTLTLDGTGTQLYSDAVSGATTFVQGGTLIKTGSGTWVLDTDQQSFLPDAVIIDDGTLDTRHYDPTIFFGFTLPTGLSDAAVTVEDGGVLLGDGRIGGLVVHSGGVVAPGHSTGTLTIAGDYQPASGSIYEAQISGDGTSDMIDASGAATIAAGAELKASKYGATPLSVGTRYTVLTAGIVSGAYTVLDGGALTAFLRADPSYDGKHAYLTIVQSRDLAAAGATANQRATAAGLQSAPTGNAARLAALNLSDDSAAAAKFDALSGEIHAAVSTALLANARAPREIALDRLRTALGHGVELWSRTYGALGHVDGDGNAAAIDNRTGGFLFGADLPLGGTGRIGVFGGAGHEFVSGRGTAESADFTVGAYGGAGFGPLAIRLGGSASAHEIATDREAGSATYGGATAQAFGELGYVLPVGPLTVEPVAGLSYAAFGRTGFAEQGPSALSGGAASANLTTATLGLHASADFNVLHLRGALGWQHVLGATVATSTQHFGGGADFTVAGPPLPHDSVTAGLDIDLALSSTAKLTLGYAGTFAPAGSTQSASAQFRLQF